MIVANMNEIIDIHEKYIQLHQQHFVENVVFSYQWWILVLITAVLWAFWIKIVDKKRLYTILLVGLITCLLAVTLDDIGLSLALWVYPYELVPFTSHLSPVDFAIVPVGYMLLYQYFDTWKPYLAVLVLLSLFAIIVAEPIFAKLDMYLLLRWKYWYSGPIYVLIGIFVKAVADKMERHVHDKLE